MWLAARPPAAAAMMVLLLGALLLGPALVPVAGDVGTDSGGSGGGDDTCGTASADVSGEDIGAGTATAFGWRVNKTHPTAACNMPVLDVGGQGNSGDGALSSRELARRLAAATTPLLIRGLLDGGKSGRANAWLAGWRAQSSALGNRSALMAAHGELEVQLSVAMLLAHGPESTRLDGQKLAFMQEAWVGAAVGSGSGGDGVSQLGDVERQVQGGEARPRVSLADWLGALRGGTTPPDSYVFHNISGGTIAEALAPLHSLWGGVVRAQVGTRLHAPTARGRHWVLFAMRTAAAAAAAASYALTFAYIMPLAS
jgi:hypothetical protein